MSAAVATPGVRGTPIVATALRRGPSADDDEALQTTPPAAWGPRLGTRRLHGGGGGEDLVEDDPQLRILGPHGRLLDTVLREVHEQAGLASLPRERVGLFAATGPIDARPVDIEPALRASRGDDGAFSPARFFDSGFRHLHPLWPLSMLSNVSLGQIAIDLNLRGDNLVLASDEDAGARALVEAAASVAEGRSDAALCGLASEGRGPFAAGRAWLERRPPQLALTRLAAACALRREQPGLSVPARWLGGATGFSRPRQGLVDLAALREVAGLCLERAQLSAEAVDRVLLPALLEDLGDTAPWRLPRAKFISWPRPGEAMGAAAPLASALADRQSASPAAACVQLVLSASAAGGLSAFLMRWEPPQQRKATS